MIDSFIELCNNMWVRFAESEPTKATVWKILGLVIIGIVLNIYVPILFTSAIFIFMLYLIFMLIVVIPTNVNQDLFNDVINSEIKTDNE